MSTALAPPSLPLAGGTLTGPLTVNGNITASGVGVIQAGGGFNAGVGSVDVPQVGAGIKVAEGANAKQGVATLAAGTVTVADTSVTATSRIQLTTQAPGGTAGFLVVSARVPGTSFTILSSNVADTSQVAYFITEPG